MPDASVSGFGQPRRNRNPLAWLPALAAVLVAAAAIASLVRLPAAVRDFDDRAAFNGSQNAVSREIAGADAEDIDNQFLEQALALVPDRSSYAIVRSQTVAIAATYGIKEATYNALPGFVQNALLPRRQVDPANAQYLLCYACNTDPFDPRLKRLWQNGHGLVIGRFTS